MSIDINVRKIVPQIYEYTRSVQKLHKRNKENVTNFYKLFSISQHYLCQLCCLIRTVLSSRIAYPGILFANLHIKRSPRQHNKFQKAHSIFNSNKLVLGSPRLSKIVRFFSPGKRLVKPQVMSNDTGLMTTTSILSFYDVLLMQQMLSPMRYIYIIGPFSFTLLMLCSLILYI